MAHQITDGMPRDSETTFQKGSNKQVKIAFTIAFVVLSVIQIHYKPFDVISLAFMALASVPFILPLLRGHLKSIELWGVKLSVLDETIQSQQRQLLDQQVLISKFNDQQRQLSDHQALITKLVVYSMSYYLYDMLHDFQKCEQGIQTSYIYHVADESKLVFLRDHAYIHNTFKIRQLQDKEDIASRVKLTPTGNFLIETRKRYEHPTAPDLSMAASSGQDGMSLQTDRENE